MRNYALILIIIIAIIGAVLAVGKHLPFHGDRSTGIDTASDQRSAGGTMQLPEGHPPLTSSAADGDKMDFSGIEVPDGGTSIASLYADKTDFSGKEILVRGKVVKFNPGVMGKNWIHLRDGTGVEGTNDLTVTTNSVVDVGDVVLVKGALSVDKDFGFGYEYAVILEDADVTVEHTN